LPIYSIIKIKSLVIIDILINWNSRRIFIAITFEIWYFISSIGFTSSSNYPNLKIILLCHFILKFKTNLSRCFIFTLDFSYFKIFVLSWSRWIKKIRTCSHYLVARAVTKIRVYKTYIRDSLEFIYFEVRNISCWSNHKIFNITNFFSLYTSWLISTFACEAFLVAPDVTTTISIYS